MQLLLGAVRFPITHPGSMQTQRSAQGFAPQLPPHTPRRASHHTSSPLTHSSRSSPLRRASDPGATVGFLIRNPISRPSIVATLNQAQTCPFKPKTDLNDVSRPVRPKIGLRICALTSAEQLPRHLRP